jgi:predicted transcriptional regulator
MPSNSIRTSVALDKKTWEMLQILVRKKNATASDIIRRAITTYFEIENAATKISPDATKIYTDFLADGEHVIVDIEHWAAIWEELNEKGSEKLWKEIAKSGFEHGIQYKDKGLTNVYDILRYMELGNFFKIKIDAEGCYTLVLSTHTEQKFLKLFLENIFKAQGINVEIRESFGKLRIIKKD